MGLCATANAAPAREVVAPPAASLATTSSQTTALQEGIAAAPSLPPPVDLTTASVTRPVQAVLSWRLDKTGRLTAEEVLSPAQQSFFAPYNFSTLPRQAGTGWFRLDLAAYDGRNGGYSIDLNTRVQDQLPSDMRVWLVTGAAPAQVLATDTAGLYRLPDTFAASTVFIRAAGLPAVGFAPELRPIASVNALDLHGSTWLRLILAGALLLGLLRGIFEQREWRMWAALYAGALLVADVWGFPATPDGRIRLLDLPGLLAPGIALLLLPHVGRHIMRSREQSTLIDIQFIVAGLIGLALTLVPLLSSHVWTVRYLPLWPLGMLLLAPTTLAAMSRRIPGAGRFLWICILPPLGLLAFAPLPTMQFETAESAGLWTACLSLLPVLSLAASSVLIALAPTPKHIIKTKRTPASVTSGGALARPVANPAALSALSMEAPHVSTPPLVLDDTSRMTSPAVTDSALPLHNLERRMRGPLDILLNEIGAFDQMKLPRELVDHAHRLSRAGRQLALLIGDISSGHHGNPVAVRDKNSMGAIPSRTTPFDLYEVILHAHNAVAEVAEAKNLSLSWFTAPHLARSYVGEGDRLSRVLTLLAESAVHATDRGIVQIRVQRLPESNDPGQLLFTVSDTGKGAPPLQRSSISLVQVWELVGPSGGTLNVESGPTGTSIAFSMRLQVAGSERTVTVGNDIAEPGLRTTLSSALRILVVSDVPGSRQLLTYYLDELPHEVREARSADEALGMYTQTPGALLIFDGDLPEADVVRTVAAIRAHEGEHNYPLSSILALVKSDEQMDRLRRAGCTHTLLKPVSRTELRQLALRLAPLPRARTPRAEPVAAPKPAVTPQATPSVSTDKEQKAKKPRSGSLLPSLQLAKNKEPAAQELEFLKAPTLDVRSNVSEPKPLPRKQHSDVSGKPSSAPASKSAPLPHLPNVRETTESGMPELVFTPSHASPPQKAVPQATLAPVKPIVPGTPVTASGARAKLNRPDAAAEAMTPAEQELDNMLREAETIPLSSPNRVEQAVVREQQERKAITWQSARQSADSTLSRPYSPHDQSEWVGEPMPISASGAQKAPALQNRPVPQNRPALQNKAIPADKQDAKAEAEIETALTLEATQKSGFFKSFFDVFQKKPVPVTRDFTSAHIPSSSEWVGEPMPISKAASPKTERDESQTTPPLDVENVRETFAHLPDPDADKEPVAIPLADLTRTTPDASSLSPDSTGLASEPDDVPLVVNEILPEAAPAPATGTNFEVPAEDTLVEVAATEVETGPMLDPLDPLAPVMLEDSGEAEPVEAKQVEANHEVAHKAHVEAETEPKPAHTESAMSQAPTQRTSPAASSVRSPESAPVPSHGPEPLSLEPKNSVPAPVTRLYLPGMEPSPMGGGAGELRLVEPISRQRESEEIFTLTDVVSDSPPPTNATTPDTVPGAAYESIDLNTGFDKTSFIEPPTAEFSSSETSLPEAYASKTAAPETALADPENEDVESLLQDIEDLSQQARSAFETGERAVLQKTATNLASAASALGLHGLIDLALCLEEEARASAETRADEEARAGDPSAAASLLAAIDDAVRSARM